MQSTTEQVFSLLRASLFTDEDVALEDCESVYKEMIDQAVAALPGEWILGHSIQNYDQWFLNCACEQAQWTRIMYGQDQLLELLEENHVPCVIIKGTAAAMYYPYPYLRSMGDVDLLVRKSDFYRAAELLEKNNYVLTEEKNDADNHYSYIKDNIDYELHWHLPVVSKSDDILLALFEKGIEKREWRETEEYKFPVLPSILNGLVLIFHINQHLREGLGLRQIIDWMMYVNHLSEKEWNDLVPVLRNTGMEKLAFTVTAMCQKYLGLKKNTIEAPEEYPYESFMNCIMENGNFGIKTGLDGKTAAFTLSSVNLVSIFRRLQAGGLDRWEAARKHKIFRPFAWIYQSFRIIRDIIRNKVGPKRLLEQREKGLKNRSLINELELQVDYHIQTDKQLLNCFSPEWTGKIET